MKGNPAVYIIPTIVVVGGLLFLFRKKIFGNNQSQQNLGGGGFNPMTGGVIPSGGGGFDPMSGGVIPSGGGVIPTGGGVIPTGGGVIPTGGGVTPSGGGVVAPAGGGFRTFTVATQTTALNVRSKPNTKASVIGSVAKGARIFARPSSVAGWSEYSRDGRTVTGFVSSQYLRA